MQEEKKAGKKHLREPVLTAHRAVLAQRPQGIEEYVRLMQQKGVETLLKRNEAGKLIGVQFAGSSGEKIKASDVDRSLTANRLENTLHEHAQSLKIAPKPTLQPQRKPGIKP